MKNAIARLAEGLARYDQDRSDTQIRDGLIQRFEFTYERAHKTLKRYLQISAATPQDYDAMAFAGLIRSANETGLLLHDWPSWRGYRDMRVKNSHTFDETSVLEVVAGIHAFLDEATFLRDELRRRPA